MYLDTLGLVTVGIGNLIDPVALALPLPFQFKAKNKLGMPAGKRATKAEIQTEWTHLKNHPKRATLAHLGHTRCRSETDLELAMPALQQLFWGKTSRAEADLKQRFAAWDRWPADAQLCVLAMAWGLGTGQRGLGQFLKFNAACNTQDFDTAAKECTISTWRADRNTASIRLLRNAARVVKNPRHYQIATLYYPNVLVDTVAISV